MEPGTTVVSVQPTYQQLYSVPESLGAEVHEVRLREADGYLPDLDAVRAAADARTGLIVLNNPNNPTGALIDEPLLRELVEVAREHDAWLFCDEVYRRLEHEPGTTAPSVADLYEKGVSSGSMSKSYSLAGLRTGWVAGPAELIARCLDVRDYTTISAGVLDDALAAVALEHLDAVLGRSLAIVRGNLALVDEWVAERAAAPLRAAACRHHRPDPLRVRRAVGRVLPAALRPERRLRHARRGVRRGARLPPRVCLRARDPRGRTGGGVRVPSHAGVTRACAGTSA